MNSSESTPAIVDFEGGEAPTRSGKAILALVGVLVGALLWKTFPALTPVWLGPILVAAVVADIFSVWFVRNMQHRFSGIAVYRLTLPQGVRYVADDTHIKSLITCRALSLPVASASIVALVTSGFFFYRLGVAFGSELYLGLLRSHGSSFGAAIFGIFAAVLMSKAVLSWRLTQAVFRSAGLPHIHVAASTTFILSLFLSIYVLGTFGMTAYEALKPAPPRKTIGDLVFSSPSPKGTFLIEHRESLKPSAQVQREIHFVDPKDPSARTHLFSYARAATVTFSPDESRFIVSEKRDGFVRPVFMATTLSLRGGAMGFVHQMRARRDALDARLRNFYSAFSNGGPPPGNIWIGEWVTEGEAVMFALEVKKEKSAEQDRPHWLCVWDYKQELFTKIENPSKGQKESLQSFLAEKERKTVDSVRQRVVAAINAKIAAENRRDVDDIFQSYAPIVTYREKGIRPREDIHNERAEEFRKWPEGKETVTGDIETEPDGEGMWRARFKTSKELRSAARRETQKEERAYECVLVNQNGRLLVSAEKFELLKGETQIEPVTPAVAEVLPAVMSPERSAVTTPAPATPRPLKFPEGTWTIQSSSRDEQESVAFNNVLTVRGATFQYDLNQIHDLINPNNPWRSTALQGLSRYSYTTRFLGKVIRSDSRSFVVKITDQRVVNKKPAAVGIGFDTTRVGQEWIFIKSGDGIFDKRDPKTFFRSVNSAAGKEDDSGR